MRILVVEDEESWLLSLQAGLEAEQYLSAPGPLSSGRSFTQPGINRCMGVLVAEDEEKLALSLQAGLEAKQYLSAPGPLSSGRSFTQPGINRCMRVLVVEDEEKLALSLQAGLEAEQYSVRVSYTGEDGFYLAEMESFDLLILDLMLPGHNGIEILASLRKRGNQTPVLILSGRDSMQDRVLGLDTGADDYLVKPFGLPELLARVRALSRRGQEVVHQHLTLEDLEMNTAERSVTRSGRRLNLTTLEYDLLKYLLINKCRVVSRQMLTRDVWKDTSRHIRSDNVVDSQIVRLRKKLDGPFEPKLLHTVRGVGFVLKKDD